MTDQKKSILELCSKIMDFMKEHSNDMESIMLVAKHNKGGILATFGGAQKDQEQALAIVRHQYPETWEHLQRTLKRSEHWDPSPFGHFETVADFITFLEKETKLLSTPSGLLQYKSMLCQAFEAAEMPIPESIVKAEDAETLGAWINDNSGLVGEALGATE